MTFRPTTRRSTLAAGAAAIAGLAMPTVLRAEPAAIKIGLIHPVTGPLAFSGNQCRIGGQMAITDVNAAGGIKTMGGAKLEALLGDSQLKPELAASLVDQFAEAGAAGFTGCYASSLGLAATQAAAKYGLPFSIDSGVADSLTTRGLANTFRLFPSATVCVNGAVDELAGLNKAAGGPVKTAVLVHENSEFGTTTAATLKEKLPAIGIKVLDVMPHATPTRDFTNVVLRIKEQKPDLVIISNYLNEYVLLIRTLKQQRVPSGIFSVFGGGFSLKFAKEQNDISEDVLDFNNWQNPKAPTTAAFRKRLDAAGVATTYEVFFGYYAVKLLADAFGRAGTADKAQVVPALGASTFYPDMLPYNPTKFVNGQNQGAQGVGLQVQHADVKVVWPDQFADAKAIFPRPKG
ncbi:MAG: ABC transporter substrate-binding protein [Rhodospirillales bacterium]|nr:ABC transporter substrate-binding protein [Rhodospirillales bacterium]